MKTKGARSHNYDSRRRGILDAANRCFGRKGFHASSMKEICEEAAMSPGALYRYFPAKDDIVIEMVTVERHEWEALLLTIPPEASALDLVDAVAQRLEADSPAADLMSGAPVMLLEVLAEASRNPRVRPVVVASYHAVTSQLAARIRTDAANGRISAGMDPDTIAALIVAAVDGLLARSAVDSAVQPDAIPALLRDLARSLLHPVAAPSRRRKGGQP
jgi:TetR/AcrR family transcriptional regulator, repressor for uid operon